MKNRLALALAASMCLNALPAMSEVSISGFGTVGYAQSDQSFAYQRFVDKTGTFKRDSVFGVQLDAKITPQIGFTLQTKMAPSISSDSSWDPTVTWAFVSYRPSNDWLLRLGKQRIPLYLHSENTDVGATFDLARLPAEVYSTVPTTDFTGASFGKTWNLNDNELSLDGYWGKADSYWRTYKRDNIPGFQSAGSLFSPIKIDSKGLVLTLRQEENTYRAGLHKADVKSGDGESFPVTFPYVDLGSGVGYYQVSNDLPGPGIQETKTVGVMVYTLGADAGLGNDFRLMGEYVRRAIKESELFPDSQAAYLSLRKRIGKWTPYATYARLRTEPKTSNLYQALNNNTVPDFIPNAELINASQRAGADSIYAYDQSSWSVGSSYSLSPTSKIKAEWMRVHIGAVSGFVDAPPGENIRRKNINVLSLNYNFVF